MADTIFALSSGRPPAAVSIIRISGPLAHHAAREIVGELPEARFAAVRELRHPATRELLDSALILRFDGPASSTGEDVAELQCHGGRAVTDAVLGALGGISGLRPAVAGEFTRRAFDHGRIDLTEAEGLADLIEAETESQRKAAMALADGGLRRQIDHWQAVLLGLSARAEQIIDYDEDDGAIDPALLRDCDALAAQLQGWLDRPQVELLKDGVKVVIAGPPNAGKSSLFNAISGEERAIVTPISGTTRDHLDAPLSLDGVPIRLVDTAGLRDSDDQVEAIGIERAHQLVEAADVLLWMGEPSDAPDHPSRIHVHGKADLQRPVPAGSLPVSAMTGEGLAGLLERVGQLARQALPAEDALALNRRQAGLIGEAGQSLIAAARPTDAVLLAEDLRAARSAFDRLTGRAGVEDMLDALFGRFCLGK